MTISYEWRGPFESIEVERLHAAGFERTVNPANDWWAQVNQHSLGWVLARAETGVPVGFVNVAWDGGVHAFILDTVTSAAHLRQGIGTELVKVAADGARAATLRVAACRLRGSSAHVLLRIVRVPADERRPDRSL